MSRTTLLRGTAVVSGLLIAILLVMGTSRALFSNPTSNDANAWSTGSVVLVNELALVDGGPPTFDETGAAAFTVTDMVPGDTNTDCFEVIYQGSVGADILLDSVTQGVGGVDENSIGDWLNLTITRYTNNTCTVGAAAVASGTVATPVITEAAWSTAVPASRWYEITVELDSLAPNTVQNSTIDEVEFEWLATNN